VSGVAGRFNSGWGLVFKWVISLGLLALVLAYVPLAEIGVELAKANFLMVAGGIGLLIVMRLVSAVRMRIITRRQGMTLSITEILKINFVTGFFGLFLPGYIAAGAMRWHMLSGKDRKRLEALTSVAFDRVNDMIVMLLIGGLSLATAAVETVPPGLPWILGGALGALIVLYLLLLNSRTTHWSQRIVVLLGLTRWTWFYRLFTRLTVSMARFHSLSAGVRIRVWGLSLLFHVLGTLAFYLIASSLELNLSLLDVAWLRAVLSLLFMLPLSVSGIGVRETALVVLLAPFGISSAQAVAYSFLMMSAQLVLAGIGGLLAPGVLAASQPARSG
jgi:uncharacterized protein (TIRG00374 family)